jgi:hypothetical protein
MRRRISYAIFVIEASSSSSADDPLGSVPTESTISAYERVRD